MNKLNISIREAQRFIDRARVYQDGLPILEKNAIVQGPVEIVVYEPSSRGLTPLFEEDDFALFNKPSNVLVHPTSRQCDYSLLDEILHLFGPNAHIVHRLDRETSGLIMVAKNKESEVILKQLFEKRKVQKSYLALVRGELINGMDIDAPLLNNQSYGNLKQRMLIDENGKPSSTQIVPLKFWPEYNISLVEAFPHTGRQHQIRAHLFHVKHPILGDPIYGVPLKISEAYLDGNLSHEERILHMGAQRLMLHAHTLSFTFKEKNYYFRSGVGNLFYPDGGML
jgi:23S rRNA pseudouridine1911/1915/1917 synthase